MSKTKVIDGIRYHYNKKFIFSIEMFLDTRAKLRPKDEFFVIEADEEEGEENT